MSGASDSDDPATQDASGERRVSVLYVGRPTGAPEDLEAAFEGRDASLSLTVEDDGRQAMARLEEGTVDCVVAERLSNLRRDFTGVEPPVVLFTDKDPAAIPQVVLDQVATLVERGGDHSPQFLAEKILGVTGTHTPTGGPATSVVESAERLGEGRLAAFAVDGDGTVRWSNSSLEDAFPADAPFADWSAEADFYARVGALVDDSLEAISDLRALKGGAGQTDGRLFRIKTPDGPQFYRHYSYPLGASQAFADGDDSLRLEVFQEVTATVQELERLDLFETLVERARDGLYVTDANGVMEFVNQSMADMLRYDRDKLVDAHASMPMAEGELEIGQAAVQELIEDPDMESIFVEQTYVTPDGEPVIVENHNTLRTYDGEYAGLVGVMRNIEERKERERRLEQFAAMVSHDLRNPLDVAKGRANVLPDVTDVPEEAERHLQEIYDQLDRMERIIDDLLMLAKEGEDVTDPSPQELAARAEVAWGNVETAGASVEVDADVEVHADGGRLLQLFENLFRNAVEHGGAAPTVRVGTLEDDADSGFYVADDGPGIPDDERTEVLERGFTTGGQGPGLGLAIVRKVAKAHGWDVSVVESDAGGARFEFRGVERLDGDA